jgi:hypothetical protein
MDTPDRAAAQSAATRTEVTTLSLYHSRLLDCAGQFPSPPSLPSRLPPQMRPGSPASTPYPVEAGTGRPAARRRGTCTTVPVPRPRGFRSAVRLQSRRRLSRSCRCPCPRTNSLVGPLSVALASLLLLLLSLHAAPGPRFRPARPQPGAEPTPTPVRWQVPPQICPPTALTSAPSPRLPALAPEP